MNRPYPLYDQRPEFLNMKDLIRASAADFGDAVAVSYRDEASDEEKHTVSYVELEQHIRALGTEMIARGMQGKRICVVGKLTYSWIITYFAALSIGSVLVPLDPEWTADDLADTALNAEVSFLICDNDIAGKGATICEATGITKIIYTKHCDGECVTDLIPLGTARMEEGNTSFDDAVVDTEAMSLLVFTSGTTGQGKGVMLSVSGLLKNIYGAQQITMLGKKTIGVLPPHHTFGSTIGVLASVCVGCELYISNGLRYFAREMQQEQPDNLVLVPLFLETFAAKIRSSVQKQGKEKMFNRMIKVSGGLKKTGINMSGVFSEVLKAFGGKLKRVICGGAPLSRDVYELFTALGLTVMNGYGITECSPLISVNRPKHIVPDSVGMPILNVEVKLDGCGDDGEGEICVKGPNVMLGYYKNEEATREVIDEDGFFHTGDIGKIDPKTGYIFITGRSKNLIILSNGKNVYPEEIESELCTIPGVSEIVVYEGQSRSGTSNNRIVAEVYVDPTFAEHEKIADVKEYLKPYIEKYNKTAVVYKRIGMVRVRSSEFPKNTLRKIVRFKLDKTID